MEERISTADAKRNEHMHSLLQQISEKIDLHSPHSEILPTFESHCRFIVSEMKDFFAESKQQNRDDTDSRCMGAPFSNEVIGLLCTLCVRLDQEALFLELLSFDFQQMPRPSRAKPSLFLAIGMGVAAFGPGTLEPNLTMGLTRVLSFNLRCMMIDLIIDGFKAARPIPRGLEASYSGNGSGGDYSSTSASSKAKSSPTADAKDTQTFYRWAESHYKWALSHCSLCKDKDFACLMQVGLILGREFFWEEVIPMMKKQMRAPSHLLSFMEALLEAIEENRFPREIGLDTFRAIFYNLHEQRSQPLINHAPHKRTTCKLLASILYKCLTLNLTQEFDQTTTHLLHELTTHPLPPLPAVLRAILTTLLNHLLNHAHDLSHPHLRHLYTQTLQIFTSRYIRSQPHEPQNWSRPPSTCACTHCAALNPFLTDPYAYRTRVAAPFAARIHLEAQLGRDGGEGPGEFRCETDRRSAAHVLVVMKRLVSTRYERENEAWRARAAVARGLFGELGAGPLKELLGEEFDAVFHLGGVRDEGGEGSGGWRVDGDDEEEAAGEKPEIVFLGFVY